MNSLEKIYKCPVCKIDSVYLSERNQKTVGIWQVKMVCPECFCYFYRTVERSDMVQILEIERLRREEIEKAYAVLSEKNRQNEIENFSMALQQGAILPIDF